MINAELDELLKDTDINELWKISSDAIADRGTLIYWNLELMKANRETEQQIVDLYDGKREAGQVLKDIIQRYQAIEEDLRAITWEKELKPMQEQEEQE